MEFKSLEEIKEATPVPATEDVLKKLAETEQDLEISKKFVAQVAGLFSGVEKNDDRVSDVVFNASIYQDFRKADPNLMSVESQAKRLKNGLFGGLWGANVWVARIDTPKAYNEKDFAEDHPVYNKFKEQEGLK